MGAGAARRLPAVHQRGRRRTGPARRLPARRRRRTRGADARAVIGGPLAPGRVTYRCPVSDAPTLPAPVRPDARRRGPSRRRGRGGDRRGGALVRGGLPAVAGVRRRRSPVSRWRTRRSRAPCTARRSCGASPSACSTSCRSGSSSAVLLAAMVIAAAASPLVARRPGGGPDDRRQPHDAGAEELGVRTARTSASRPTTATPCPSGHTTAAASVSAALLLVVPPRARPWAAVLGAGYTTATGISTLIGQWHRPSDVVAAVLVVLAWTAIACALVALTPARRVDGDRCAPARGRPTADAGHHARCRRGAR